MYAPAMPTGSHIDGDLEIAAKQSMPKESSTWPQLIKNLSWEYFKEVVS